MFIHFDSEIIPNLAHHDQGITSDNGELCQNHVVGNHQIYDNSLLSQGSSNDQSSSPNHNQTVGLDYLLEGCDRSVVLLACFDHASSYNVQPVLLVWLI